MLTLLLATRNRHKAAEIQAILGKNFVCRTLLDFPDAPEIVEDATTFAGNATRKALGLAGWLSLQPRESAGGPGLVTHVLADDSGLEVDALNGAPGVQSARFAAIDTGRPGNSADAENNAKLLRLLQNVPAEKRTARFHCVLALTPVPERPAENASPACYAEEAELRTELFDGVCEGRLGFAPQGQGGFGYDPLFFPEGFQQSFAQLGESVKNQLSHRARALTKLKTRFGF